MSPNRSRWLLTLPLQQGTSSYYLPARRPTGSPVPSLPPCTRDERDQVFGIPPGLGHSVYWPAAATATTDYEEPGEKVIGAGSKWLWLWCWVIMSDMMGGAAHLPLLWLGQPTGMGGSGAASQPAPQLPKVAPGATQNLQPILLCNAPHLYISPFSKGCNQSRAFPFLGPLN